MFGFASYLNEDAQGKNLHLEHLEDEILNFGIGGARGAINFLQALRDMLAGNSRSSINMTVKWDGAPAIFAGVDPSDGKFFVAKKSVFNKTPLLYKTKKEIQDDSKLPQALKYPFTVALEEFSKLGIKGVLQGDLMFTAGSLETEKIDGQNYTTFQPNTIVYAVPRYSDLDNQIRSAKIGIVWHTTYTGSSLEKMSASFGANISGLRKNKNVWMDDATYRDESGTATFTKAETAQVTSYLSTAGRVFQRIGKSELDSMLRLQESLANNNKTSGATLKTYNNSKVRVGEKITNPRSHAAGYEKWVSDKFDAAIGKLKSEKAIKETEKRKNETLREIKRYRNLLINVITFQNALVDAKMIIVRKLNSIKQLMDTFVRTKQGFKVVNPEGYVAIDRVGGNAVKLVDRMEFSYNNFTAIKAWDR